jgi:Asp-tRNA(Asn)/Glu-tRNA(Gln) amidotransferase C subunit
MNQTIDERNRMNYLKSINKNLFIFEISDEKILISPLFKTEDADSISSPVVISDADQKTLHEACNILEIGHTKEITLAKGTKREILGTISRISKNRGIAYLIYTSDARVQEIEKKAHLRLAELTGIVRHDVMNQITAIMGYFEIINDMVPEELVPFTEKEVSLAQNVRNISESTRSYQALGAKPATWISINDSLIQYKNNPLLRDLTISGSFEGIEIFADPEFASTLRLVFEDITKSHPSAEITCGCEEFSNSEEEVGSNLNHLKDEKCVCIWFMDNSGYFAGLDPRKVFHHTIIPTGPAVFCVFAEICNLTEIVPRIRTEPTSRFELLVPASSYLLL